MIGNLVRTLILRCWSWINRGNLKQPEFRSLTATGQVRVGRHTYGSPHLVVHPGDRSKLQIGAFCSIAEGVEIFLGGNHRVDWVSTYPFRYRFELGGALDDGHPASKGDITIGNDVWIGHGATILSGVTIGNGAVVGARSVVAGDVRPYAIVVGNPAREVRRRFADELIERLENVGWWEWPIERILDHVPLISSNDIENFLRLAESSVTPADPDLETQR